MASISVRRPTASKKVDLRRAGRRQEVQRPARSAAPSASIRASGRCSARRCRASTFRRWSPAGSSSCTTCACRACCTARVVRPPAVGATVVSVDEASVARHARRRQGRRQKELRRRRRQKPWQADAGGAELKVDVERRHRTAARSATFYEQHAQAAVAATRCSSIRATSTQKLERRRARCSRRHISIRIRCTDRWAASCAVADVQGEKATHVVGDAGRVSARNTRRCCSACSRRTSASIYTRGSGCYGINGADTVSLRRGGAVAGRRQAGARAASRKDEMAWENYGNAVRDRSARRPRSRAATSPPGTTRRGRRREGGRPGYNTPGQRRHRHRCSASSRAPFTPRTPAPAPTGPFDNGSQHGALVHRRLGRRTRERCRHGHERARAVAPRPSRRSSPARCARPSGCRTRSRTNRSWTRSRRRSKADPVEYRLRHLSDRAPE